MKEGLYYNIDRASENARSILISTKFNSAYFYLHPDSFLREDLQLGSVIGHISEELLLIAIPLDTVQGVTLHVKPGYKHCHLSGHRIDVIDSKFIIVDHCMRWDKHLLCIDKVHQHVLFLGATCFF